MNNLLENASTAADGRGPSISVISWLKRFRVMPESVWSKNDWGAFITDVKSTLWRFTPDIGVNLMYRVLYLLSESQIQLEHSYQRMTAMAPSANNAAVA
jgi:hypothetical protein